MLQKFKKGLSLLLLGAKAVVLILILIYIGLLSDDLRILSTLGDMDVSYVLVNEDLGAVFNGVEYNLGREFVDLVNIDPELRWHTASRSVAEAGLRSGSFDVLIILPQNFSERLLALQSFTPQQAEIVYEIRHGQNELVTMSIDAQVTDILNDFNERIVRMYFSSFLRNLFDAQTEFGAMVDGESQRRSFFVDHVQDLFLGLPNEFLTVIFQSEFLQGQTEGWRLSHDHFTEITQETLLRTVEQLNERSELLAEHVALMVLMSQANARNAQAAMERQSDADESYYRDQFGSLNRVVLDYMERFHDGYGKVGSSLMGDFLREGADFEARQRWLDDSLSGQIDALDGQIVGLGIIRGSVARIFFEGQTPPDYSTYEYTNEDCTYEYTCEDHAYVRVHESIWNAISNLISPRYSFDLEVDTRLDRVYIDTISSYFDDLAIDAIELMIEHLQELELITSYQFVRYTTQLDILRRFESENEDINSGGSATFELTDIDMSDLDTAPLSARYRHVLHDFIIDLPEAGTGPGLPLGTRTIRLDSTGDNDITIVDIDASALLIQNRINDAIIYGGYPLQATVTSVDNTRFNVAFMSDNCIPISDPYDISVTIDYDCSFPNDNNNLLPVVGATAMELNWLFYGDELNNMFNRRVLTWLVYSDIDSDITMQFELSHFFRFRNLLVENAAVNDLSVLLDQVSLIERASRQIVTLFGDPNPTSQTMVGFLNDIAGRDITIRELASPDSIYNRYGHFTDEERVNFVVEALHHHFHQEGHDLHNTLAGLYSNLEGVVGREGFSPDMYYSLAQISASFEPGSFLREAQLLLDWHRDSLVSLAEGYGAWTHGQVLQLLMRENFGSSNFSETYIYYNIQSAENMIELMNLLVSAAQSEISNIISGSLELVSLDDDFNSLITNTNSVSGQMETVLGNVNVLDNELYTNVNANLAYAQNFSSVMDNARIGGGENSEFMNFLPRPVMQVGTQVMMGEVSLIPYYLTVISAILNLSAGYGLRYFWKRRERTAVDQLVKRGLIWKNTPFVFKLTTVSLAIGLIFSVVSVRTVDTVSAVAWLMLVPQLIMFGILIVAYLARQFPKTSLFVIGTVIAIYLLLNPILGNQIAPGTIMDWLFRASPLQHVEHIFARLVVGDFFGMINYVIMIVLVGLGVLLNLLVTEKSIEATEDELKDEK